MFQPRLDQERFQEPQSLGRIFEYAPGIGAVTATLMR
jgi:hypothetical protein